MKLKTLTGMRGSFIQMGKWNNLAGWELIQNEILNGREF
jgi:hypothetical protein